MRHQPGGFSHAEFLKGMPFMSNLQAFVRELDKRVTQALEKGSDLSALPVVDWNRFMPGYLERNFTRAHTLKMRWMVAEKIKQTLSPLSYDVGYLVRSSYCHFDYAQVQMMLDYLAAHERLEAEATLYLQAQNVVKKYWDDDYYDRDTRITPADEWDINRVNNAAERLSELLTLLEAYPTIKESGEDPHGFAQTVDAAIAPIQSFQTFFPEFCATLNACNRLDLTPKVRESKPTELKVELPDVSKSVREQANFRAIAKANKSVGDFQGFVLGIVLEPGSPDKRDLHGNWISKEEIFKACMHWSLNSWKVGTEHSEWPEEQGVNHPNTRCVMNWCQYGDTTIGGEFVADGTWLQAYQAMNDEYKAKFQNYELNGLSPGGMATIWTDPESED